MMKRSVMGGLGLVVLAGVAFALWRQQPPSPSGAPVSGSAAAERESGPKAAGKRPLPVVIGRAVKKDVPVYLDGLGTVQAYNTVTVRSRIDGELTEIGFSEGQDVKAGEVLARLDARAAQAQLDQALAAKGRDEAQLELARLDLQRYLGLGNRVTGQIVDTQRAQVKQLEAAVRVDQATVDNFRTQLSYTVITAPISGRAGLRQVDRGNLVRASDNGGLVVLTQVQPIAVLFTLPQQFLATIIDRLQQAGTLPVAITDSAGHSTLENGTLALIDNQIDQTTGTIRLKAVCANKDRRLWPGAFVMVRLLVDTRRDGTVIPAPAVLRGPQGAYAFVVQPDRTVAMRPVVVGVISNDEALIESGLEPGDAVVTDGMARLQPGALVAEAQRTPGNKP